MSALAKYSFYNHSDKLTFKARKSSRKVSKRKVSKKVSKRKSSKRKSSKRKSSKKVSKRKSSTKNRANRRTIEADDCINRSGDEASCGYEPNCEWVAPTQRCRLRKLSRSVTGKVSYEGPMGPPPAAALAFKSKKSRKSGKKSRRSRKSGKKSRKSRKSGKKSRKMRK